MMNQQLNHQRLGMFWRQFFYSYLNTSLKLNWNENIPILWKNIIDFRAIFTQNSTTRLYFTSCLSLSPSHISPYWSWISPFKKESYWSINWVFTRNNEKFSSIYLNKYVNIFKSSKVYSYWSLGGDSKFTYNSLFRRI